MARIIEISEKKREKMSEHVEDALYALGKVMSCLEDLDGDMGERGRNYNMSGRDRYGNRHDSSRSDDYGSRDEWDDDWDDDERMGERRRRSRRMR